VNSLTQLFETNIEWEDGELSDSII
jgi:hypothetical protein